MVESLVGREVEGLGLPHSTHPTSTFCLAPSVGISDLAKKKISIATIDDDIKGLKGLEDQSRQTISIIPRPVELQIFQS